MTSANEVERDEISSKQEARAKLRETFLRAVIELDGQQCSILTYEKSVLQATFAGWNVDGHEILVKELKTPTNQTMESVLLRTPDVLALQFNKPLL